MSVRAAALMVAFAASMQVGRGAFGYFGCLRFLSARLPLPGATPTVRTSVGGVGCRTFPVIG
jgi:hypothetical protein